MKKKENTTRKKNRALCNLGTSITYFTGNENHDINLIEASELTRNYRIANPNQTIAHFFGKKAILDILNQDNCVGIRIYYALDAATGQKHLVIVGAEANMNDMAQGLIAERSYPCPTYCSSQNALNS